MVFRAYLLLKHYTPNTGSLKQNCVIRLNQNAALVCTRHVRRVIANNKYASLKPLTQNPGSGLGRPINAEHLLCGWSTLKELPSHFVGLFEKEESCFLPAAMALIAGVSMERVAPIRPN